MPLLNTPEDDAPPWFHSPEQLAARHNLTFPDSAGNSPIPSRRQRRRRHRCRSFSADLSEMRSLRLFYSDEACTSGQLVLASRESQYKILHFHHGGLERLTPVLRDWAFLRPSTDSSLPYSHFMVCRPEVTLDEQHPEEGKIAPLTKEIWLESANHLGQYDDDLVIRKAIFFGGLEPDLRREVWPFLLRCYSFQSIIDERNKIKKLRALEYENIT